MPQQHAFSLSTRFFFPRRHFASALSRQGRLLFWLISVFLLFFQNKSQGRHNITTYPKKSTAVSTMVHKPTTAVTKRRSKRSEDEWHVRGHRPTSFSFSRTEKKNRCRIFHNGVRWRKGSLKRSGELPPVRNERRVRGKKRENSSTSTDSNVNVNLEPAWFGRARGCCKAATARL